MKIWFPTIRTGTGTEVFTVNLVRALRRRGVDCEVTWFAHLYELVPFLLKAVRPPDGTDVIHANSWSGFAFAHANLPLVVTEHLVVLSPNFRRYQSPGRHFYHTTLIRLYEGLSFSAARAVTAVSQSTAADVKSVYRLEGIEVIPNWVDTERFCPSETESAPDHSPFILMFVGKPSRRKGADLLGPIMQRLGPGFELRMIGTDDSSLIPGAPDNIRFMGHQPQSALPDVYRQCDALLFPSRLEGLPLVVLEAMASGKPVIASRTSSLPEVLGDEEAGLLCPVDDVDAFVDACRRLQQDRDFTMALGKTARHRTVERFSEESATTQYISLYKRILEG
jgi:glycosyltransferase involved in cell wall biosynthesis